MKSRLFSLLLLLQAAVAFEAKAQQVRATIKPNGTANQVDVFVRPDFAFNGYFAQYQFPIAFPTGGPQPTSITFAKDAAFSSVEETMGSSYSVTVYAQSSNAPAPLNTMNYFVVSLVRAGSNTYTRAANTEYKVGTVSFNGPIPTQVRILDNIVTGGNDGQANFYAVDAATGNYYRNDLNAVDNFYTSSSATTVGGTPAEGFAQTSPTGVPLSASLLTFSATATPERTAKLEWQTATEKNSSHFLVERSADGMRFTDVVARMQATGTSAELLNYQNFDFNPLTGANFYRVKMVNKDGSIKYSETRRLVFEAPMADVIAMPNPFPSTTGVRINADRAQIANYYVMDAAGRRIRTGVWEIQKGVQEYPLEMEDAAAGNYILTVQGSTILAELKLIKTN